jgi:hypothetical protein
MRVVESSGRIRRFFYGLSAHLDAPSWVSAGLGATLPLPWHLEGDSELFVSRNG